MQFIRLFPRRAAVHQNKWLGRDAELFIALAIFIAGCQSTPSPSPVFTPTPIPSPPPLPTLTASPTSIPTHTSTTAAPTVTSTRARTATRSPSTTPTPIVDFSKSILMLQELPQYTLSLSVDQQRMFHSTQDEFIQALGLPASKAKPINYTVFFYPVPPSNPQTITTLLMYPLDAAERALYDSKIETQTFATFLADAQPYPGMPKLGDKSAGVTLVRTTPTRSSMRNDAIIVRRGAIIELVYLHYLDTVKPPLSAIDIARLLDGRVATALGK